MGPSPQAAGPGRPASASTRAMASGGREGAARRHPLLPPCPHRRAHTLACCAPLPAPLVDACRPAPAQPAAACAADQGMAPDAGPKKPCTCAQMHGSAAAIHTGSYRSDMYVP